MKPFGIGLCWVLVCGGLSAQTPLEVNQARELDLDGLSGLGPATTRRILIAREKNLFKDWADLMRRTSGIGPKKALQLSEQGLLVNGKGYAPTTTSPATHPTSPSSPPSPAAKQAKDLDKALSPQR